MTWKHVGLFMVNPNLLPDSSKDPVMRDNEDNEDNEGMIW